MKVGEIRFRGGCLGVYTNFVKAVRFAFERACLLVYTNFVKAACFGFRAGLFTRLYELRENGEIRI
ncbi:hypothetical protein DLM78_23205 [Leptospira stimsonii]|uniref:Uncharacterized protein n=2 Tax=Leptospira stimsonii TaxID=2202203 RepID=A0A8B3CM23_9LEPT|nr:hypothetical protein DLM78_23205 [Leptospira stimsonii]